MIIRKATKAAVIAPNQLSPLRGVYFGKIQFIGLHADCHIILYICPENINDKNMI
jgi:hypothetical protein